MAPSTPTAPALHPAEAEVVAPSTSHAMTSWKVTAQSRQQGATQAVLPPEPGVEGALPFMPRTTTSSATTRPAEGRVSARMGLEVGYSFAELWSNGVVEAFRDIE